MIDQIIYNATTIVELLIMTYMYMHLLGKRERSLPVWSMVIVYVAMVLYVGVMGIVFPVWWGHLLTTLIENITIAMLYGHRMIYRIGAVLLYVILSVLSELISTCIFASFGPKWQVVWSDYTYSGQATLLFSKLVLFLCIILVVRIVQRRIAQIHKGSTYILLVTMVFSIGVIISTYFLVVQNSAQGQYAWLLLVPTMGMLCINLLISYLMRRLVVATEIEEHEHIMRQQISEQEKRYNESNLLFRQMNGISQGMICVS